MVPPLVRPLAVSCLALALGAGAALADTVTLKNGREIHGKLVEERKDEIVMKIEGGLLPIPKRDIATFTENENFGRYGGRPRAGDVAPPAPARPGDKPGAGGEPSPGVAPGDPAPGARPPKAPPGALTKEGWTWAGGVSEAKVEELTPVRDKLLEELEKLGPTAQERLEKATPSADEKADIAQLIQQFALRNRRRNATTGRQRGGSANLRRGAARDDVVEHGAKAIEQLKEALGSENLNTRRYSAEALIEIAQGGEDGDKKDVQWLMYHHGVPGALIALFDFQDDITAPFVRKAAHDALAGIMGKAIAYPETTELMRTPEEAAAMREWQKSWQDERAKWQKAEKDKEAQRKALTEKLEKVRAGQPPE